MIRDEDAPTGAPEWAVTFGDMMSLLLTFFILLVSMSEIKKNDRFQGIADSIQQHFGNEAPSAGLIARELRPRSSEIAALAVAGRNQRHKLLEAGADNSSGEQLEPRVKIVRPGERTTIGTVIYFDDEVSTLSGENRGDLDSIGELLRGKPQIIEVRGHTSRKPPHPTGDIRDNWDLAYQRCRNTLAFLVTELNIDPVRIRLSVAGANEPASSSADPQPRHENPRVEVFLLEEVAEELTGVVGEP